MSAPEAAARYAGLAAIETGVTAAKKQAADELRSIAEHAGLTKGEIATPFGPVTLAENKGAVSIAVDDEDAFIAWAQANHPDAVETVTRLRTADRTAILTDRFVTVAGHVVDSITGEQIDFAHLHVTEAAAPSPSYRSSDLQREAKRAAIDWATDRAPTLVEGVRELVAGETVDPA